MARDLSQAAVIQEACHDGSDVPRPSRGVQHGLPHRRGRLRFSNTVRVAPLGDVSGKGMPDSLLMMALHARVQVLAEDPGDLAHFMTRINKATCANCPSNRFITFFFSILNAATGELTYANAGHNPPILVRANGDAEMLEGGGPVLGILPIAPYSEMHTQLDHGDMLVLYSDGVTEAHNPAYEEFDEARFIDVLKANRTQAASQIVQAVINAVTEFAAGAPQADDITMLIAKRL